MTRIFLSFLILFTSINMFCQQFPAPGAEWRYQTEVGWSQGGGSTMKYIGDTIYNGALKKVIHVKSVRTTVLNQVITSEDILYLSQTGDSIFRHYSLDATGEYAFKINYEAGETTHIHTIFSNDQFFVEKVDTFWFENQMMRRYKMQYAGAADSTYIYDVFGPELGFVEDWWAFSLDGTTYHLRCYRDDNLPFYSIVNNGCLSPSAEPAISTISIVPNPGFQYIEIQGLPENMNQSELLIFNALGEIIVSRKIEKTDADMKIEIAHIPAGIYSGVIHDGSKTISFRFAKI